MRLLASKNGEVDPARVELVGGWVDVGCFLATVLGFVCTWYQGQGLSVAAPDFMDKD